MVQGGRACLGAESELESRSRCKTSSPFPFFSIYSLYICQGVLGITFICGIPTVLAFCHVVWQMPETEKEMPLPCLSKQGIS